MEVLDQSKYLYVRSLSVRNVWDKVRMAAMNTIPSYVRQEIGPVDGIKLSGCFLSNTTASVRSKSLAAMYAMREAPLKNALMPRMMSCIAEGIVFKIEMRYRSSMT